jgi:hypothetical protein
MDGELLRWLYHRLLHDPTLSRTHDCTYGDGLIVFVYFFAALSGRSTRWAARRSSWPLWCRSAVSLPSYSQLCKRLKTASVRDAVTRLNDELRDRLPRSKEKLGDGKPLVVGGFSHDPDARWGKAPNGWANGYKLHLIVDAACGAVDAMTLTPLSAGEATVLRRDLIPTIDCRGMTLLTDANYDSNPTYRAMADAGGRLIAPRRKPFTGIGHHPQHPHRLTAIALLEGSPQGLGEHKRRRIRVEQSLGQLTNLPFGLAPLPNFVRRLERVRLWVLAKITLYHLYKVLTLPAAAVA